MKEIDKKIIEEELEEIKEKKKKFTLANFIKELIPYVIILIVVIVIRTYLVTPIMVSGPSMKPTLDGGEVMILNKLGKIDRYDVVVVDIKTEDIIKRVLLEVIWMYHQKMVLYMLTIRKSMINMVWELLVILIK